MRYVMFLMFLPSVAFSAVYNFNNAQLTHIAEIIADDPAIKADYSISSDLLAQNKAFSFRIDTDKKAFVPTYKKLLADSGVTVTVDKGFYRYNVTKTPEPKKILYKYKPAHRTPEELAGAITDKSAVSFTSDYIFFDSVPEEIAKFKQMMANADIPRKAVTLKGYLYATTANKTDVNALTGLINLLTGKLNYRFQADVSQGYLSISSSALTALLPILDSSSEYVQLSSPISNTLSGKQITLKVGSSTPVLTGTTSDNGVVTQNIEYRDSGLVWQITPTVFANRIELDFYQSDSTFKTTETGVNNTPTLDNRSLTTTVSMRSGDVVILAGYGLNEQTKKSEGWGFLSGKSDNINRSDFVLLIQAVAD
uniref:GspD protein n=1 Tax=Dulem virus 55 TaxID=3145766 RepID=A0AAU8B2S8_9VIRU